MALVAKANETPWLTLFCWVSASALRYQMSSGRSYIRPTASPNGPLHGIWQAFGTCVQPSIGRPQWYRNNGMIENGLWRSVPGVRVSPNIRFALRGSLCSMICCLIGSHRHQPNRGWTSRHRRGFRTRSNKNTLLQIKRRAERTSLPTSKNVNCMFTSSEKLHLGGRVDACPASARRRIIKASDNAATHTGLITTKIGKMHEPLRARIAYPPEPKGTIAANELDEGCKRNKPN